MRALLPILAFISASALVAACSGDDNVAPSPSQSDGGGGDAATSTGFALNLGSATISMLPGETKTISATITPTLTTPVDLSVDSSPPEINAVFDPPSTMSAANLTVTVAPNAAAKSYPVTLRGRLGAVSATANLVVAVGAPTTAFDVVAVPKSLDVQQGQSAAVTVNVVRHGAFNDDVQVSLTGAPYGVAAAPITIPAGVSAGSLTLLVSPIATPAQTTMPSVHAVSGTNTSDAQLQLKIHGASGGEDTTFANYGHVTAFAPYTIYDCGGMVRQSDGKLVLSGYGPNYGYLARFTADGAIDTSYDTDGWVEFSAAGSGAQFRAIAIQSDGKVVAAGGYGGDFLVARFTSTGALDTSFDTDGWTTTNIGGNDNAFGMTVQGDGKIVVVGQSDSDVGVARYNTDGSLDTSFNTTGTIKGDLGGSEYLRGVAIQSDNKIVTVGYKDSDYLVVRLTTAGALDTAFDTDGWETIDFASYYDQGGNVALQSDGKILVVGTAGVSANNRRVGVARLLGTDGSLDTSFDTDGKVAVGGPSGDEGWVVAVQPDGKILAGGSGQYNYFSDFYLFRLTTSGALDGTFSDDGKVYTDVGSYYDAIHGLALLPDGRIVAGGFSNYPNYSFALARYWP